MSRPSAVPRYYESEHELQRLRELREELTRPRAVLRKHQSSSSRPRDLQLVEDPPASSGMLAWVDRFVAPPPTSPTLKSAPPIGTLHVQVSPDDSTYRVRNIRPDGARTHVRRPSAQEVQDRLRHLPSANNHPSSAGGVIGNLPMRSNSFNRRASNHLPPSPAVPIAPVRRHQPGTADLHLRLNVQDVNPVWDGSQDRMMVERGGGIGPRPPLIRAPPPQRPPRPNNVNLFDDEPPQRPPPLSLSSSTSSSSSSGQSSRNPSPQTPTSPATPSAWTSYYADANSEQQQQQVEPPLPPLPVPMARSPPASMGFGRRAKSPPSYSTRPVRPAVNLTGGTTGSGSLTSIGNLMTTTSPIPTSPIPESTLRALGLDDDDDDSSSPFTENALNAREEERTRERDLRRSASTRTTRGRERSLPPPPPPEPVQEERGRQNASARRERSRPPGREQEEPERQNAFTRRERSQPPPPEPAQEEPERQNAFSRLRDFTRARSKSLSGRDSSRRRRTPSPPSRAPPLPTSPLLSTPNSARTIRAAPGSPRPLYHMDFLTPHTDDGPQSRPHSIAVSESSVITAGGTRYNIRNKALRVVNAAPSATSGSSRGSIASRSSLGSTITALFSHSTSSKSSVSDRTTTSSSKSSERLESLKARALEEDIYRALNLPHVPYYSPSPSSRGDSPLPPPSFTFQDYCSSPRSSILSSPSSPRAKYAGINVDPQNRLEFDVRRTLEELSLVEEEVWGKGRVQAWEKEPDLENTDDAAMGLETLVRVERKKRGKTRPERRGPIALRVPRR
ncbi:hypothetical protein FRC04_008440 [Tulasnella sp. 424]|nr:hypothetical protein FRC04_008440 [Tulasnella sp. 424]KAG8959073.1 hypothetical protein FRC05_008151 [Tulasnella sp. 425]